MQQTRRIYYIINTSRPQAYMRILHKINNMENVFSKHHTGNCMLNVC